MKLRTICALSLVLAAGCDEVEDRLSWSPDGTRAILRVNNSLHFVDTAGNLSAVFASNVTAVAWLPDSQGLVLVQSRTVDKWKDAENLLPPDEIAAVQTLAKGYLAFCGAGGIESNLLEQLEIKRPELFNPVPLYILDTQPAALRDALQKAKDPAKIEADLSNSRTTTVCEVSIVSLDGKKVRVIERTLATIEQPRPSFTAPAVAFLRGQSLTVAPLDGSTNRVIAAERVESFDWMSDGKTLVYAQRMNDKQTDNFHISDLDARSVVDTNGALVAGGTLGLTMSISAFAPRVQCLANGRVLFASIPLQVPPPTSARSPARFYLIDPALGTNAAPTAIPSTPGSLPQDLAAFAPSPDGKRIAIVESGSDVVAVLDVATGALEVVSPNRGAKSRTLPAWRGNDELYFAACSTRPEVMRWHRGSTPQVFSGTWSDAVVTGLVEKSK